MAQVFCLIFPTLLLYAAWSDIKTMEIPNWVSIVLALGFIPAALTNGFGWQDIGLNLVFGAGMLVICAILFYLNVFGGGDAKVIAAASLWTGLAATGTFVMAMAVAGGGLAFLLIVLRRLQVKSEMPWAARLLSPDEGAPYAVAIAIGALVAVPAMPILSSTVSALQM